MTGAGVRLLWEIRRYELAPTRTPLLAFFDADVVQSLEDAGMAVVVTTDRGVQVHTTEPGIDLLERALSVAAACGLRPHHAVDAVASLVDAEAEATLHARMRARARQ